jgi:hypothetical protein
MTPAHLLLCFVLLSELFFCVLAFGSPEPSEWHTYHTTFLPSDDPYKVARINDPAIRALENERQALTVAVRSEYRKYIEKRYDQVRLDSANYPRPKRNPTLKMQVTSEIKWKRFYEDIRLVDASNTVPSAVIAYYRSLQENLAATFPFAIKNVDPQIAELTNLIDGWNQQHKAYVTRINSKRSIQIEPENLIVHLEIACVCNFIYNIYEIAFEHRRI